MIQEKFNPSDFRTGVVLSGGGARGIAHIGFLQALAEAEIEIHAVSGTSMGAIVGLLYSSGLPPEEILEHIKDLNLTGGSTRRAMLRLLVSRDLHNFYLKLADSVGTTRFSDLDKSCFITASNLNSADYDIFYSGNCIHAALASTSIPLIFRTYNLNGDDYADGGLFNNFPIDPLLRTCSHIFGSHVNFIGPEKSIRSPWRVADRVFKLAIYHNVRERMELCDWYIDPPETRRHLLFDFNPDKLDALYNLGYQTARMQLSQMKQKLEIPSEKMKERNQFVKMYHPQSHLKVASDSKLSSPGSLRRWRLIGR